jgi:glycosyltransferase involved in cell wall biosynthesis
MVWGKGLPELLQAVATVARDTPVELHLAGDGPDRTGLVELVQELELQDRVFFAGSVLDITRFWTDRDVAVFPTNGFVESFGLAAVEAMASAVPVVASRSGGLAEVVDDGRTGTLVAPGDVAGLAAALRGYAVDRHLRLAHGSAARAACEERFDIRACAKRYLALFDD